MVTSAYEDYTALDSTHLVLKLIVQVQKMYAPKLLTNVGGADLVAELFFPVGPILTAVDALVVGKFKWVIC